MRHFLTVISEINAFVASAQWRRVHVMANRPLTGSGPVPFTAPSNSKLYYVPLTGLSIKPDGKVEASDWVTHISGLGVTDQESLDKVLAVLVERGTLRPGVDPTPGPSQALVFRATRAGVAGNNITVSIMKVEPDVVTPGNSKLDLTVVESVEYKDLSTDSTNAGFVGTRLDTAALPQLVKLKAALTADIEYPLAGKYDATSPDDIKVTQQAGAAKTSFVLVDADGVTGPGISVVVTAPDKNSKLFALTVTRTTTKLGATLSTLVTPLSADADSLKHAIVVVTPTGTQPALPELGKYGLIGGSDKTTSPAVESAVVAFTDG